MLHNGWKGSANHGLQVIVNTIGPGVKFYVTYSPGPELL